MGDTKGHGPRDAAGLSVRAMAAAVAQLGRRLTKSQVQRDYSEGAPREVGAYLAWRTKHRDFSRSSEGRIDRPQTPAPNAPVAHAANAAVDPPAGLDSAGGEATAADSEPADEHTEAFRKFRADNERIKNERGQLELAREKGELVAVADIEALRFTEGRIVRDRVLMVPARVSADLHAGLLSLVPEEQRAAFAALVPLHTFERRLDAALRDALHEAARAIEDASRDDDDPDA